MIKRISILCAVLLLVSFCACSSSSDSSAAQSSASPEQTSSEPAAGSEPKAEYQNTVTGYAITRLPDSFHSPGIFFYTEFTEGDLVLVSAYDFFPKDGYTIKQCMENTDNMYGNTCLGTMAFSNAGNDVSEQTAKELSQLIGGGDSFREIKRNDGHNLYYWPTPEEEIISDLSGVTEEDRNSALAAAADFGEMAKNVIPFSQTFPRLSFSTIDFDGNPITSEECFSGYDVTLLDCWASFCSPCKKEMPELVKADRILRDDGCQVLLLLYDTDSRDSEEYQDAVALLEDAGATSLKCILVNEEIAAQLQDYVSYFPTIYPVGSDGQILGAEYGGDRSAESFVDYANSFRSGF